MCFAGQFGGSSTMMNGTTKVYNFLLGTAHVLVTGEATIDNNADMVNARPFVFTGEDGTQTIEFAAAFAADQTGFVEGVDPQSQTDWTHLGLRRTRSRPSTGHNETAPVSRMPTGAWMVGPQGLEPRLSEPESDVLPLDDGPSSQGRGLWLAGDAVKGCPVPSVRKPQAPSPSTMSECGCLVCGCLTPSGLTPSGLACGCLTQSAPSGIRLRPGPVYPGFKSLSTGAGSGR